MALVGLAGVRVRGWALGGASGLALLVGASAIPSPVVDLFPGRVQTSPATADPRDIALADMDLDGRLDAVVADRNSSSVAVLHGRGDGTFEAPRGFPTGGNGSVALAVADFDGDGVPDVAVAHAVGTVSVLRGTGDGGLVPGAGYSVGDSPAALVAADFDGDGDPDLATADEGSGTVTVLRNAGGGAFEAAGSWPAGKTPCSLAAADLNGDGHMDLAAADRAGSAIVVLFGKGDGTVARSTVIPCALAPGAVAVADLNRDGRMDLLSSPWSEERLSEESVIALVVRLGRGRGSFAEEQRWRFNWGSAFRTRRILPVELDGDGCVDVVLGCAGRVEMLALFGAGNGRGRPDNAWMTTGRGEYPETVAVGDANGDGLLDIVAVFGSDGTVRSFSGTRGGTFGAGESHSIDLSPSLLAGGDFDGDGRSDFLAIDTYSWRFSILLSLPDGSMRRVYGDTISGIPGAPAVGDFNEDGRADFAFGVDRRGDPLLGVGLTAPDGTLSSSAGYVVGEGPAGTACADFDGDGHLDLATANWAADSVSVLPGNGDGIFRDGRDFPTGDGAWSIAAGDLDGDGRPDLVTGNVGSDTVTVLRGRGDGTFETLGEWAVGRAPRALALGDLDGDGDLDVAVACAEGAAVWILRGRGDGSLDPGEVIPVGRDPVAVAVADMDLDGRNDLLSANRGSDCLSVFRGLPGEGLGPEERYRTAPFPSGLWLGDRDADGRLDAVLVHDTLDGERLTVARSGAVEPPEAARLLEVLVDPPVGTPPETVRFRIRWDREVSGCRFSGGGLEGEEMEGAGSEWTLEIPYGWFRPGGVPRIQFEARGPWGRSPVLPGPFLTGPADRPDAVDADGARPQPVLPAISATVGPAPPEFSWDPGPGATGRTRYAVRLGTVGVQRNGFEVLRPERYPVGGATRFGAGSPGWVRFLRRWERIQEGTEVIWFVEARDGRVRASSQVRSLVKAAEGGAR